MQIVHDSYEVISAGVYGSDIPKVVQYHKELLAQLDDLFVDRKRASRDT